MQELPIERTVYSMSAQPPTQEDRRNDERHLTLFRVGAILIGQKRKLCLVKNISAGGALVRPYCKLQPEQRIQIELKEQQPIPGSVTWVRGSDAGITFDERVDVVELLKTNLEGPRPRMPRVEIACVCFVREGAIVHRTNLHNISQGGISVECAHPLTSGTQVTITLPGLPTQLGSVRWNEGSRYGIAFNDVLPLAALVEWLHSRQSA